MVDPDVPNPQSPVRQNYLHWYVSGNRPSCINNQSPNTVAPYQPPSPGSTQQHRYTFLVYREPPNYVPDTTTPQTRAGFDVNAYAQAGGLVLVGGNFFLEAITNT
jgi:phosphatidylethanolamine-binding protein